MSALASCRIPAPSRRRDAPRRGRAEPHATPGPALPPVGQGREQRRRRRPPRAGRELGDTAHRWQDTVLDSLRTGKLECDRRGIQGHPYRGAAGGRLVGLSRKRKARAYAQLFPADGLSVAALPDLESWFRTDRATREPRGWGRRAGHALGAAEPQDLPAIAPRPPPIRMGMSDLPALFTSRYPAAASDTDAAEAFKAALGD